MSSHAKVVGDNQMSSHVEAETSPENVTFVKGLITAVIILVIAVVYIVLNSLVGLENVWIGLTVLTLWSAIGHSKNEELAKAWVSAFVGILLAYLLAYLPTIWGVAGTVGSLALLILLLAGMVSNKLTFVCNFYTFIMLNVFTAHYHTEMLDHLTYLPDLLAGAVLLGALPYTVLKILENRKAKAATA